MANKTNSIVDAMVDAVEKTIKKKTAGYDSSATVKRIDKEKNIAWVHIPGGVDETPVKLTVSAKAGDIVQVRVSGGRAFIVGNASAPPTDDTTAIYARTTAVYAQNTAESAKEDAAIAHDAAVSAVDSAATAGRAASVAQSAAEAAMETANTKKTVFVTTPEPPYHVGDLWVKFDPSMEDMIDSDGNSLIDDQNALFQAAILKEASAYVCMNPKLEGQTFSENDFELATADSGLREWFWHDAAGAHVLGDATGYRNDIDSTGMHIVDTTDEQTLAEFTADGAQIGKDDAIVITNEKVTASETYRESIVSKSDNAGVGTYSHTLKYEYEGDLHAYFYFGVSGGDAYPNDWVKDIALDDFGSWSISALGLTASGSVSFNPTTNTITLQVDTMSGVQDIRLLAFNAVYTTKPRYAAMAIGDHATLADQNMAFVVGGALEPGNVFEVDRYGYMYLNGAAMFDFVTEYNRSGDWSYRKWHSGKTEAWYEGTVSTPAAGSSQSKVFYTNWSLTIPSGIFASTPYLLIGAGNSTNVVSINGAATSATAISGRVWRNDTGTSALTSVVARIYAWEG